MVVEYIAIAMASMCGYAGAKASPASSSEVDGPQDSGDFEMATVDRGVRWG